MSNSFCPFEKLELKRNASQDEIRQQFKKLSKKYHPDRNVGNSSVDWNNLMAEISKSHEILLDPRYYELLTKSSACSYQNWFSCDNDPCDGRGDIEEANTENDVVIDLRKEQPETEEVSTGNDAKGVDLWEASTGNDVEGVDLGKLQSETEEASTGDEEKACQIGGEQRDATEARPGHKKRSQMEEIEKKMTDAFEAAKKAIKSEKELREKRRWGRRERIIEEAAVQKKGMKMKLRSQTSRTKKKPAGSRAKSHARYSGNLGMHKQSHCKKATIRGKSAGNVSFGKVRILEETIKAMEASLAREQQANAHSRLKIKSLNTRLANALRNESETRKEISSLYEKNERLEQEVNEHRKKFNHRECNRTNSEHVECGFDNADPMNSYNNTCAGTNNPAPYSRKTKNTRGYYACSYCEKGYTYSCNLRRHIHQKHSSV